MIVLNVLPRQARISISGKEVPGLEWCFVFENDDEVPGIIPLNAIIDTDDDIHRISVRFLVPLVGQNHFLWHCCMFRHSHIPSFNVKSGDFLKASEISDRNSNCEK